MKIRNGFVSNSSSSSFIIAFPKKPESAAELMRILFPGKRGKDFFAVIDEDKSELLSYKKVSEIIFNDLVQNKPIILDDLTNDDYYSLSNGRIGNSITSSENPQISAIHHILYTRGYDTVEEKERKQLYDKLEKLHIENGKNVMEWFRSNIKETDVIYRLEYGNEDSDDPCRPIIEFSNTFDNLKHIYINNH